MESGRHLRKVRAALAAAACALALGGACSAAVASPWHAREVVRWGPSQRAGEAGAAAPHRLAEQGRRQDTRIGGEGGRRSSRAQGSGRLRSQASVFLERCVRGESPSESYVTFAGQMATIKGAVQMAIRIDVEERGQGEATFHRVAAKGLGVWRLSEPGVSIFRDVKQVTNLASPVAYRALVRFHWLDAAGRVTRRARMYTPVCRQPAPSEPSEPSFAGEAPTARML